MTTTHLRTIGRLAGLAAIAAAALLAVLLVAPGAVGAEATYVVQSDSMSPTMHAGDLVVIGPADARSLSEGEIVSFRRASDSSTVVTHRIVAVEETADGVRYRTKGDANEEPDRRTVAPSQVVGSVWIVLPAIGHLVAFANTDLGLVVLVILPAVALAVGEVYELYARAPVDTDGGDRKRD